MSYAKVSTPWLSFEQETPYKQNTGNNRWLDFLLSILVNKLNLIIQKTIPNMLISTNCKWVCHKYKYVTQTQIK